MSAQPEGSSTSHSQEPPAAAVSESHETEIPPQPLQPPTSTQLAMVSEANSTEHLPPAQPLATPGLLAHAMYKNLLQEYTQRSAIPLPIYQNINEGPQHAPKYRSTVLVDGIHFTSPNTFSHRKAAEQDVARIALLDVHQTLQNEVYPLICEDTVFCKSILIEYAVKTGLPKPTYTTATLSDNLLQSFVSSLDFNGLMYVGDRGKTKKEAEQLAARAVILSILDTEARTAMYQIIKSKFKHYAALHKVKDSHAAPNGIGSESKGVNAEPCAWQPANAVPGQLPLHVFKRPRLESSSEAINAPIVFVPPAIEHPQLLQPNFERKRKKKEAKKRTQISAQLPVAAMPLDQISSYSVAQ